MHFLPVCFDIFQYKYKFNIVLAANCISHKLRLIRIGGCAASVKAVLCSNSHVCGLPASQSEIVYWKRHYFNWFLLGVQLKIHFVASAMSNKYRIQQTEKRVWENEWQIQIRNEKNKMAIISRISVHQKLASITIHTQGTTQCDLFQRALFSANMQVCPAYVRVLRDGHCNRISFIFVGNHWQDDKTYQEQQRQPLKWHFLSNKWMKGINNNAILISLYIEFMCFAGECVIKKNI